VIDKRSFDTRLHLRMGFRVLVNELRL